MLEKKLKAGVLLENTEFGVPQEGIVSDVINYVNKYNLDIFLGPEWLFVPKQRLYSESEKENMVNELLSGTKERSTLIIPGTIMWEDEKYYYNSAPVISGGELLGEYYKILSGGTHGRAHARHCEKTWYGGKGPGLYTWRDYAIGVEICADHGLLKEKLDKNEDPLLDLYFLSSCGALLCSSWTPVKPLGYGLCSDGWKHASEVLQRKDFQDDNFKPIDKIVTKEGCLDIYRLKMQKPGEK